MENGPRCRHICVFVIKLFTGFFTIIGLAVCVLFLTVIQIQELSRMITHGSRQHTSGLDTGQLAMVTNCLPCAMKNVSRPTNTRDCGSVLVKPSSNYGKTLHIVCEKNQSRVTWDKTDKLVPFRMTFEDPCLKTFVQQHCRDGLRVPTVVHYVWFSKHTMNVYSFLSVLSASRILKPCAIFFHSDYLPLGPYWKRLLLIVDNIVFIHRQPPDRIYGSKFGFIQHKADIARMEALKEFGGIYLDCDQIALRSFDDLRNYDFVMGHENAMNLGNSVLVSIPNATFLHIWHQSYKTYDAKQWGIHSTFVPFRLAKKYPSLIHIENDTLITPDLGGILAVYYKHYDWSRSYAIHLYTRFIRKTFTLSQFRTLDTALGEIVRMILYGSTTLCSS